MANSSFRLPTPRSAAAAPRRGAAGVGSRPMNAEAAARIALRRLGNAANGDGADSGEAVGCSGWFDSTWELRQGLDICEVAPSELPLEGWLQVYLAQRPLGVAVTPAVAAAAA